MRRRWADILAAGTFAFVSVGCASAAATSLLGGGLADPQFVQASVATAGIFAAFTTWVLFARS